MLKPYHRAYTWEAVSQEVVVIVASNWTKPEPSFLELRSFSSVSCALPTVLPLKGRQLRCYLQERKPALV